ncbi:hypothetical protein KGF86_14015 [Ornithinibacillus massiliensis]|uniref:Phospholipid phosphatase n=1 Tax=Ornithinibacillus massiliensis TaxID=1944633 RepID=A0ABS5MGV8_9BACI|nr:hypothetical protein [Ornithinibacillus massiliensis]MBS3681313.1 hypothetical protein [Ornithinibacillus massiliensis]
MISLNTFIYFLVGLGNFILFLWGISLARKYGFLTFANVILLVLLGLVYDNVMIALGKYIGEGHTLESLNLLRYWLHTFITPTLILFAWNTYYRTGLPTAKKTGWKVLAAILTIGLILYESLTTLVGLELRPNWKNGVLTYEGSGSALMVIIITIVIGVVGFILWKKFHFPWLFIGTLSMVLGGILAGWLHSFPIMNILELLFMASILMTKQFQDRNQLAENDSAANKQRGKP